MPYKSKLAAVKVHQQIFWMDKSARAAKTLDSIHHRMPVTNSPITGKAGVPGIRTGTAAAAMIHHSHSHMKQS
jgi:hypothetical protein